MNLNENVNCSTESAVELKNVEKNFKNFKLDIPEMKIPRGFATALIGENGAGKTTLMNIIAGIRRDYKGELKYFGKYSDADREKNPDVKLAIGYTGTDGYYMPYWNVGQVEKLTAMLFSNFDGKRYREICGELAIFGGHSFDAGKKVNALSDGTKTKLMLAGVLARDTELLLLDEPASPLDPLMRDKLCELIRDYLGSRDGRSVFFSTHNISDMENVTDYAIIMEHGSIVEQGFIEDLKEKYILVKGENGDAAEAEKHLFSITKGKYGFEGICLAENLDRLAGLDIITETASLFQISVAVMKRNSYIK